MWFFWKVIKKWPSPEKLSKADVKDLEKLIRPLGLSKRRAVTLKNMSKGYIENDWRDNPTVLYGIGKYGSDAYQIFCTINWESVSPKDGALVNYHNWLRAQ